MIRLKKLTAVIMALVMFVSTSAMSFYANAEELEFTLTAPEDEMPYLDGDTYYRVSFDNYVAFNTNYDEMIEYIKQQLVNRNTEIQSYMFATTNKKYQYIYEYDYQEDAAKQVASKLSADILADVFAYDASNPQLGEYLYNNCTIEINANILTSQLDSPSNGNDRYYTFRILFSDITYETTLDEENEISTFAKTFTDNYISADATEYEKVKIIYDYILRNTTYDYDTYKGLYSVNSNRYRISHTAYGAIWGNLIANDEDISTYDMTSKKSVTNQPIIKLADQGLSVCEGYSKLFYYLCIYNGINCHIVDGDYITESGKSTDPHEWNYVYLDDGCGDGYKWFQVDTTFASQQSFKEIDINSYNYFLCGTNNDYFSYVSHQQAYSVDKNFYPSAEDYNIPLVNLDNTLSSDNDNVLIRRDSVYPGDSTVRTAFIVTDMKDSYRVIYDNDDNEFKIRENVEGFVYNGVNADYTIVVPYLIDREYTVENIGNPKECGNYTIHMTGEGGTNYETKFNIIPLDMSNDNNSNYDDINVQTTSGYTGDAMTPHVNVVDKYGNELVEGKDYSVKIYSDADHTTETEIRNIGKYYLDVTYTGNYTGHYYLEFNVEKIKLSQITANETTFEYLPEYYRSLANVTDATSYFNRENTILHIGDIELYPDVDYSLTAKGGLEYGDSGTITLTGKQGSEQVEAGTKLKVDYTIGKKFDITDTNKCVLNGAMADSNKTNVYYYTGSAIKPTSFDNLDKHLVQGKDYEIVSYSNNVNAGTADVTIKGINGCTGTITMHYIINKVPISKTTVTTSTTTGVVTYTVSYNGKKLVKNTDYTETLSLTSTGYQIKITGIGNFTNSQTLNIKSSTYKPSSSGNTIALSATKYVYNGNAKTPSVSVYNKNGKAICPYYYTISYATGRKTVGSYKVTVKFRNGYSGSITKSFTIVPNGTTISSVTAKSKGFTVKWKKQATQTTGYQIQYSTSSKFSSAKTVTVSGTGTVSKSITKLKAKKKYYVRVRTYKTIGSTKYYSSWSSANNIKTK